MDRGIVFAGAIPQDTDLLFPQRAAMTGLAGLSLAVLGSTTLVDGLTVGPNSPAALNVLVQPGAIFALANVDATAYGALTADTTHSILKQGIIQDVTTLTITPPGSVGFSQVFLVQGQFQETDSVPVVLPYYNAANPSVPFSGPANAGTSQNTRRLGTVVLQLKAGTAATTGTQVAPSADAGWTGVATVTVANGATTVIAGNIAALTPRRVSVALPDIPRLIGAVVTTASVNTTLTLDQAGLVLASASGGNRTMTLPAANAAGTAIPLRFTFTRTDTTTANTLSLAPAGSDTINGLTSGLTIPVGGSVTLISDGAAAWRLMANAGLKQIDVFTATGTATAPWWARSHRVRLWGGGGGGGGSNGGLSGASGGGGGGYAEGIYAATPGATTAVTVGANGAAGVLASGTAGGSSSFGALVSATGGTAGVYSGAGTYAGSSGVGGTSTGGAVSVPGLPGGGAIAISGTLSVEGKGGGAFGSSNAAVAIYSVSANAAGGTFPGGGGSGGVNGAAGGAGAFGLVIVEWLP